MSYSNTAREGRVRKECYYADQLCSEKLLFLLSSSFQTHFVQLTKPSQVFVRPTGIQALPSPVNSP